MYDETTLANLVGRCRDGLDKLSAWDSCWKADYGICRWEVDIRHSTYVATETGEPLFSSIFFFTDVWRAYEFCMYSAIRILLLRFYDSACRIPRLKDMSFAVVTKMDAAEIQDNIITSAVDICRSIDYFLHKHGQVGALLFMFSAQIALFPLGQTSGLGQWLAQVLRKIGESDGLEIGRQLLIGRCTDLAKMNPQS